MQTQLLFTRLLNHALAPQANWLLGLFHVTPAYAAAPITNAVSMEFLVFVVLLLYFIAVRLSLSVEKPNGLQHLAEMLNGGVLPLDLLDARTNRWIQAQKHLPKSVSSN